MCVCVLFLFLIKIFALSKFFVSRFMEGQRLLLRGEAPGIEPRTSSPISQAGRPPFISCFMGCESHHMHPRGGYTSSPVSWARKATYAPKAEALGIEPMISSPIYQARRPPFISRFMGRGLGGTLYILGFSLHKRRN